VTEFLGKMERALMKSRPKPQMSLPIGIPAAGDHLSVPAPVASRHGQHALAAAAHAEKG